MTDNKELIEKINVFRNIPYASRDIHKAEIIQLAWDIIETLQNPDTTSVVMHPVGDNVYALPGAGGCTYYYPSRFPPVDTSRIQNWAAIALDSLADAKERVEYIKQVADGKTVK